MTRPMTQCERCAIRSYQKLENDCADAERRLIELQEAVRWERECLRVHDDRFAPYVETWEHYIAARAEVDKLIGGE